jgi:hypothetical protein
LESNLASGERQHKIRHPEVSTCATHIHPLLGFGDERRIKNSLTRAQCSAFCAPW